jgi:hypothetical protein
MRTFGFLGNRTRSLHEVQIPGARLARVNQSLKRRLDDDVEEVFNRACATNDLDAASDLLALLEKWHSRRQASYGRERRISGANLTRARGELDRLNTLKGANAAGTPSGTTPADAAGTPSGTTPADAGQRAEGAA